MCKVQRTRGKGRKLSIASFQIRDTALGRGGSTNIWLSIGCNTWRKTDHRRTSESSKLFKFNTRLLLSAHLQPITNTRLLLSAHLQPITNTRLLLSTHLQPITNTRLLLSAHLQPFTLRSVHTVQAADTTFWYTVRYTKNVTRFAKYDNTCITI
jgi:hypothetical protein